LTVGPAAEAVILRFENLPEGARKSLLLEGHAKWLEDGRLKLGPGGTIIRNFPKNPKRSWPTTSAVVVMKPPVAKAAPLQQPRTQTFNRIRDWDPATALTSEQFTGQVVSRKVINVSAVNCPIGGGGTPGGTAPTCSRRLPDGTVVPQKIVVGDASGRIDIYCGGANGVVPPVTTLFTFWDIIKVATDGQGQIYALSPFDISVFPANASSGRGPTRTISLGHLAPLVTGFAADDAGELFISAPNSLGSRDSITVLGPGPGASQIASITDGLDYPIAVAVDRSGSTLCAANLGPDSRAATITVYKRGGGNTFARTATLPAPDPQDSDFWWSYWIDIAVDSFGTVYALVDNWERGLPPKVVVWERAADGTLGPTPTRQITNLGARSLGLAVDLDTHLYVTEFTPALPVVVTLSPGVEWFWSGSVGSPSRPVPTIVGPQFDHPVGIAVIE
jgi:hypothetical protein